MLSLFSATVLLVTGFFVVAADDASLSVVARDIGYGADDENQALDIYYRTGSAKLPVVVYVHGGGWAFGDKDDVHHKPQCFADRDVAFISMNYRLRWDHEIYDQAEDIVLVTDWIHQNADTYNLDSSRIVLMGHAAGAHLVSLVATNESFMKADHCELSDIVAVVAIDTGSCDIGRLMMELGSFIERRQHRLVFGNDQQVWEEVSPITHVESNKDIPSFALLYVAEDEESTLQAKGFAKVLAGAGVETIMITGNEKTSDSIDEELGTAKDSTTQALMTFLRAKI